jgi:hypothetical protein
LSDKYTESPVTLDDLIVRWAQRDAEYAKEPAMMDPFMADVIRQGRMLEAANLPAVSQRAQAYARAQTWTPPVPQNFGGLHEWIE